MSDQHILRDCYETAIGVLRNELAAIEQMADASKTRRADGTRIDLKPYWIAATKQRIAEYELLIASLPN